MCMVHNDLMEGYFPNGTTYKKMKERYYYSKMIEEIKKYVKTCDKC